MQFILTKIIMIQIVLQVLIELNYLIQVVIQEEKKTFYPYYIVKHKLRMEN